MRCFAAWLFAGLLLLCGCGAAYTVTRTAPDGTVVTATAAVREKQGRMAFTFSGDPAGAMEITLEKENVEPVSLPAGLLRTLIPAR
jgi:hypothetical protein